MVSSSYCAFSVSTVYQQTVQGPRVLVSIATRADRSNQIARVAATNLMCDHQLTPPDDVPQVELPNLLHIYYTGHLNRRRRWIGREREGEGGSGRKRGGEGEGEGERNVHKTALH